MRIINEPLLDTFRLARKCEWCCCSFVNCDPHHLWAKGSGGGRRLDVTINLCSLCRGDHQSHHAGHEPTLDDLLAIVAKREKTTVDAIKAVVWFLQRLDGKASPEQIEKEIATLKHAAHKQRVLEILVRAGKL